MTIVTEISEILKSSKHLSELEAKIISLMREATRSILSERLESLDKELIQAYLTESWEIARIEERRITFSFGTVSFKRHHLKDSGYVLAID